MGCISSRSVEFPNDVHPNIFTVATVNHRNNVGSRNAIFGQLEVTSTDLVLHRRGHDPVCWPLHYVRRYGFENNIFSFESGRRCESGPGIFTFRCRRAQELFFLVQTCIQDQRAEGGGLTGGDGYAPTGGHRPSSNRPHSSANEYHLSSAMEPEVDPSLFRNVLGHPLTNGRTAFLNDSRLNASTVLNDDTESVSQVFMEITPLMSSTTASGQRPLPQRHSSLATSNFSGDLTATTTAAASARPRRPHSVEVVGNGAIYCNSGRGALTTSCASSPATVAARRTATAAPSTDAYYVNVEPPQILHNANDILDEGPTSAGSDVVCPSVYSNMQCKFKTKPNRTLNYVLLDVGAPNTPASPQSATFTVPPANGYFRTRRLSNQSSEYCGGSTAAAAGADFGSVSSNYAKIDCTKTRALRDTTSARRMTEEVNNVGHAPAGSGPSTVRRTRHDSNAVDVVKRTPNGEA